VNLAVKLLLAAVGAWVAFQLGWTLVKGATMGGITRRDSASAYWSIVLTRTVFIALVVSLLARERI
jgi:hypothetical protein